MCSRLYTADIWTSSRKGMCITCDGFHHMAIPGEAGVFQSPRPSSSFVADGRLSLSARRQSDSAAEAQSSSGLFGIHCRSRQFDVATHRGSHKSRVHTSTHALGIFWWKTSPGKMQFCLNHSVNWGAMHRCDLQDKQRLSPSGLREQASALVSLP